jgi:hypothetical protein
VDNIVPFFKQGKTIEFKFPTANHHLIEQCKRDMIEWQNRRLMYYTEFQGFTTLFFSEIIVAKHK